MRGEGDSLGQDEPADRWPAVSVVVPTRDRPQLLARALASIMDQAYPGIIECIVVFDQSDPRLPSIQPREGRRLLSVVNERTPGPAGARNMGALAATGELLAFCDDDDEWVGDKLRLQVRALQCGESEVVGSGVVIHYERRTTVRVPNETITLRHLLRSRTMEAHLSTILVRRSVFVDEIGLVDEGVPGSYAEDYDWMLRAATRKGIVAVPQPLVHRYWHGSSFFATQWELMARALRYVLTKHPELQQDRRGLARIYGRLAFATAACGSKEARALAFRTLALDWRQPRGYLALLVRTGVVRPNTLLRVTRWFGRGI